MMEKTDLHKKIKPSNKGSKQLFDNPLLEQLSRTHISIPLLIFGGFSSWMLFHGFTATPLSPVTVLAVFIGGLLIFTFIEYLIHRHIFHMLTDTPRKEMIQYRFHGVHHEYPRDKDRLAMPPLISSAISAMLFFILRWFIGDYVYAFLPGFLTGYAMYLGVHYSVHAFQPPKNFLKILWINHGIHHYKDPDRAFGVSTPLWDYVFGTLPKKK